MLVMSVWRGIYTSLVRCPLPAALRPSSPVVCIQGIHTASRSAGQETRGSSDFDPEVLRFLVCPLSRRTLRYDESTSELINDELGIAYPIVDGIPNMIPQDARMIHKDQKPKEADNASE